MKAHSHKSAQQETRISELRVRISEQKLMRLVRTNEQPVPKKEQALSLLNHGSLHAKSFAYYMDCSERYIQQMAGGERHIPGHLVDQIIEVGNLLLVEQRQLIDQSIFEQLALAYGPQARINQEKGWDS